MVESVNILILHPLPMLCLALCHLQYSIGSTWTNRIILRKLFCIRKNAGTKKLCGDYGHFAVSLIFLLHYRKPSSHIEYHCRRQPSQTPMLLGLKPQASLLLDVYESGLV